MPIDWQKELIAHCRDELAWLENQAHLLETTRARYSLDGADASVAAAEDLRHRARNISAILVACDRFADKPS